MLTEQFHIPHRKDKHDTTNGVSAEIPEHLPILLLLECVCSGSSVICCLSFCRCFSAKYLKTRINTDIQYDYASKSILILQYLCLLYKFKITLEAYNLVQNSTFKNYLSKYLKSIVIIPVNVKCVQ